MRFDAALLLDLSLRMSAVLALAWVVTLTMRRAAAATRHLVWACAVAVVILLPVMQALVPDWRVVPSDALPRAIAMRSSATPGATVARQRVLGQSAGRETPDATATGSADAAATITPPELALAIWLGGAAVVLAYMLLGVAASWRIRRAATPSSIEIEAREIAAAFAIRQPVAVVESFVTTTPLACGVWRPRIVLPRDAVQWSEERRHVVVLHELAHIKRRDCLTQALAQLVCAAYWFNPLAWIAARRLRVERERACDDFVLAAGIRGSDYANHLLGIAQTAPRLRLSSVAAGVAMARRSQLEGRLMAILDPAIRRSRGPRAHLGAAVIVALSIPIAALQPQAAAVAMPDFAPVRAAADSTGASPASDPTAAPVGVVLRTAAAPQNPTQSVKDALLRQTLNATLIEFADEGHIDGVIAMLAAGADVNAVVPGDGSPLIAAADEGQFEVVRLLLDRGADPNLAVDGDGSPLIAAAGEGHADVIQLLLDRGANPNLGVIGDGSALIAAADEGHADVVQLLLDRGADVNLVVDGDENALIHASDEGHLDIVKLLVSRGADVNAQVWVDSWRWTSDGRRELGPQSLSQVRTPLRAARSEGHVDIVTYLISMGARD
jgi:beta-lactamase regulating signal transducer with metallopeptidase domain/ankyrin repeat protein